MDIELYREFISLVSHGSFVSAARDLNMSQPSLSRHISTLSNQLGCKLFHETRPLRLTAAGETVLEHACKIVGAEETLLSELANMPVSGGAQIRVVDMMHANTLYIGLNEAVEEAKESFPDLRVEYVSMEPSGLNAQQLVDAGKADIAFETTMSTEMPPATRSMDGFLAILIPEFHGEFVVGVPKGSKLAEKENLVLADLAGERFILPANRSGEIFRRNFIEACRKAGFYPNISLVPMDNAFMFYGSEPHDAVHLLVRVDRKYKPLIADLVKQHTVIKSFVDEKRYIDSFAVVDPRCEDPALSRITDFLIERADAFVAGAGL